MPPGPLDQLIEDNFASPDAATALGEKERARQEAAKSGGNTALDSLLDEDSRHRAGYIFRPDPLMDQKIRHAEKVRKKEAEPEAAPIGPMRPFVAEEVPDYADQMSRPPAERQPELRTPFQHEKIKPLGVPLNKYLNEQGIPIPENGTMPSKNDAVRYSAILNGVMVKQKDIFGPNFANDTEVAPADISSIPRTHRWYAEWLWKQKVLQERARRPGRPEYMLQGSVPYLGEFSFPRVGEHAWRSVATVGEAAGTMKDAFHEFGVHLLGLGDPEISNPDRAFAKNLDAIRSAADPSQIRPLSQQREGKSIVDLIKERRYSDIGERGYYGAMGMVPDVAATYATSGVARFVAPARWAGKFSTAGATAYWYARSYPDIRDEMIKLGIEEDLATIAAAVAAGPYAAIEQLQIEQATAPLKALARRTVKATMREMAARGAGETLKLWGTELGEEGMQAATELITIRVAQALSEREPSIDWKALLSEKGRELQEAAVTIPFLIGPRQATSVVMDFVENPSRRNYGELPEGMQNLGDADNPDDPASKQDARQQEARRLGELAQDVLAGFAMSVSKDADVRQEALRLFGGNVPTAADVATMRPEQKQALFDTPNPTQEDIDVVFNRIRKELESEFGEGQTGIEPEPGAVPVETAPGLSPEDELKQLVEQSTRERWTYSSNSEGLERIADLKLELGIPLEDVTEGLVDVLDPQKPSDALKISPQMDWDTDPSDMSDRQLANVRTLANNEIYRLERLGEKGLGRFEDKEEAQRVLIESLGRLTDRERELRDYEQDKMADAAAEPPAAAEPATAEPAAEIAEEDLNALRSMTPEEAQAVSERAAGSAITWNPGIQGLLGVLSEGDATIADREELKRLAAVNPEWGRVMVAKLKELRAAGAKVAETTKPPPPPAQAELRQRSDDLFSEEAWESAREDTAGNSRSIIIHMSPDDFLKVAETGATEEQTSAVVTAIKAGEKLRDIPQLSFIHDGQGNAGVASHEGRNRATAFKQLGFTEIPVVLTSNGGAAKGKWTGHAIRWNSQGEENSQDIVPGEWPRILLKEGKIGKKDAIPFPVPDMRTPTAAAPPAVEEPAAAPAPAKKGEVYEFLAHASTQYYQNNWSVAEEIVEDNAEEVKTLLQKAMRQAAVRGRTLEEKELRDALSSLEAKDWEGVLASVEKAQGYYEDGESEEDEVVAEVAPDLVKAADEAADEVRAAEEAAPKGTKAAAEEAAIEDLDDEIEDLDDDDDLKGLFADLHNEITGPGAAALGLNPEAMTIAGEISVVLIKKGFKKAKEAGVAGGYTFKKFSRQFLAVMGKKLGSNIAEKFKDQLVGLWAGTIYRPEAEVPPEELGALGAGLENDTKWAAANLDATIAAVKKKYPSVEAPPTKAAVVLKPQDGSRQEWVEASTKPAAEAEEEWTNAVAEALAADPATVSLAAREDYDDIVPTSVDTIEPRGVDQIREELASVNDRMAEIERQQTEDGEISEEDNDSYTALSSRRDELHEEFARLNAKQEDTDEAVGTGPAGLGDRTDLDEPEPVTGEVAAEGGDALPVAEDEAGGVRGDVWSPDAPEGVATDGGPAVGDAPLDPTAADAGASKQPDGHGSPGTNHRIKDEDNIGAGWKPEEVFEANMAAINTLKDIEESGNTPTLEQKQILAQYRGWGGLSKVFDEREGGIVREWRAALRKALTEEEYDAASASTLSAHYTSPQIIRSMWEAVGKFGFTGGKVLEPSMGVGHFFGLMPSEFAENSDLTGIELDSITGRIAKQLYQNANIQNVGFEKAVLPPEFDLVIGNVPFGKSTLVDKSGDESLKGLRLKGAGGTSRRAMMIHNFFFAKSLMKTRPGGLMVMLSSTGTLDSNRDRHIDFMKENGADLVGAVRLPQDAFKENANTGVTADILVFQKRLEEAEEGGQKWGETTEYDTADGHGSVVASTYWEGNGKGLVGEIIHSKMRGQDSRRMGLAVEEGMTMLDYESDITDVLSGLKSRVDRDALDYVSAKTEEMDFPEQPEAPLEGDWKSLTDWLREGNYHVTEEKDFGKRWSDDLKRRGRIYQLWQKQGGVLVEVEWDPPGREKKLLRLLKINEIRDAYRVLVEAEVDEEATDEVIAALRKDLNKLYDEYRKKGTLPNKEGKALNDAGSFSLKIAGYRDTSASEIESLERVVSRGDGTNEFIKADVFKKRLSYPRKQLATANTPEDAMMASLSERGRLDWEYMSELTKIPVPDLELALSNLLYKNPVGGWEQRELYLSGNVREKLAVAMRAAESDATYERNVSALFEVQPEDWTPNQIQVSVGESWIPPELYDQWVLEKVDSFHSEVKERGYTERWKLSPGYFYNEPNGKWGARRKRPRKKVLEKGSVEATTTFGTERMVFDDLMLKLMNSERINVNYPSGHELAGKTDPTATAQAEMAADTIQRKFVEWLWELEPNGTLKQRGRDLVRLYNDLNNNWAQPVYDGAHLRLPGMSEVWKRRLADPKRRYQKDNIWRMIVSGNTLLAHSVGAGKTVQMIAAAMEMRRLGLKKRIIFNVPNTLRAQWEQDIKEVYPNAKVYTPTSQELGVGAHARRDLTLQRMLTGDWDIILMSPETFERIPMTADYIQDFFDKEIVSLRDALRESQAEGGRGAQSVKAIEEALKSFESMMDKMLGELQEKQEKGQMKGPYFNELGIDAVFTDEAHEYKNLFSKSRMARIPGVQTKPTPRPFDMFMKTSWLNQSTNGKGVFFATATPITNTMGEMHVMMRYLAPGLLEEKGITTFDQWAKRYGEVETKMEVEVAGQGLRVNSRFRKFTNVQGLKQIWLQFADTKLRRDLDLDLPRIREEFEWLRRFATPKGEIRSEIVGHHMLPPNQGAIQIAVPITEAQDAAVKDLIARTEEIRSGNIDPEDDNMLKISTEGRKIATDMRLMDPKADDEEGGKVNVMVDNVLNVYDRTGETEFKNPESGEEYKAGGVQVLWVDRGTPKKKGKKSEYDQDDTSDFNLYEDIKRKLMLGGVPESEIAFIQETAGGSAESQAKKKVELFRQLNNSEKRIIIASTQSMSVGANIQQHLIAAHHLDAPWRPADVEQRDGRIIRPGNRSQEIEIYRYVTEKTFDAFMWQTLALKWGFLQDFYKGDSSVQEIDDVGEAVMTPEEMLAMATGDERIARVVKLQSETQNMDRERSAYEQAIYAARASLGRAEDELHTNKDLTESTIKLDEYFAAERAKIKDEKYDVEYFVKSVKEEEDGTLTEEMGRYTEPGKAGQALLDWLQSDFPDRGQKLRARDRTYDIGSVFGMELHYSEKTGTVWGRVEGVPTSFKGKLDLKNPYIAFKQIFQEIKGLEEKAKSLREKSGELSDRIRGLQGTLRAPVYPKLTELKRKTKELKKLQKEIQSGTATTPEVEPAEGQAGLDKMQALSEESSALLRQERHLQKDVDEYNRIQAGYLPGPLSPYKNQPFNNYMALFPVGSMERPRGSQLQETVDPSAPLSIPEQLMVDDPEVEAQIQAKHGLQPEPLKSWISRSIDYLWRHLTRAETEIKIPTILRLGKEARAEAKAQQQEIGPAVEYFRMLKNVGNYAQFEAYRTLRSIVGNLDREHFWIFERYVIVRNQLRALDLDQPRRHAWKTREQIESYQRKLEDFIDGTNITYRTKDGRVVKSEGMPHIRQAIEARNEIIAEVVAEQVNLGLLPAEALQHSENYFHQQIVTLSQSVGFATASRAAKPVKRGYQRRRVGTDVVGEEMPAVVDPETGELDPGYLDPNTDYLEAELTWLIEANVEAHKKHIFNKLNDRYGQKKTLKRKAKYENHLRLVGGPIRLKRVRELEAMIRQSMESADSGESDQRALRKAWREELEGIDPSYQYRQKKGMMLNIIREQNPAALRGTVTDDEFFAALKRLALQDLSVPGAKAARGFFRANNQEKTMIRERLGIEHMTWEKVLNRDHPELDVYEPENSNVYRAYAIPDQIIRKFQEKMIKEIVIKNLEEDADEVMVLSGARSKHVLPREIVAELKKLEQKPTPGIGQDLGERLLSEWKQWVLLNPKRALPYNIRNFLGDLDPVLAAAPGAFWKLKKAYKHLKLYNEALKGNEYELPRELRKAIEHGVIGSGIVSTEMPDPKEVQALERLYMEAREEGSALNPVVWGRKYFKIIKKYTELRENLLRYGTFLYFLEQLENGTLKHYGSSRKNIILGIQKSWGNEYAAGRLSRELLGDYQNLTAAGDQLRRKWYGYPFWAFQEINLKRYPMLLINAYSAATSSEADANRLFGVASTAVSLSAIIARMGMLYAPVMLFNWLFHREDEEELPYHEQRNLHLNLGRGPDGSMRVFRNIGSLGDFMEWFGLNDVIADLMVYKGGQVNALDLLEDVVLAAPQKLIGGAGVSKLLFEVITEQSMFPDVFAPRSQSRDETLAAFVNARDEYRWAKGMLLGEGDRARPHYFERSLFAVDHPGRAALSNIYDLRERFLEKKGKARPPARVRSTIRKLKWAAQNGDYEAFKEAKSQYLKQGHNYSSFSKALGYLDPISNRLNDKLEAEFIREWLTDEQRRTLGTARDYAQDTRVQMWQWWMTSSREKSGGAGTKRAVNKQVATKVKVLARAKPTKRSGQAKWRSDQNKAAKWLRERGFTKRVIMQQYKGSATGYMRAKSALRRAGVR